MSKASEATPDDKAPLPSSTVSIAASESTSSLHEKTNSNKTPPHAINAVRLDIGNVRVKRREKWWQIWIPGGDPPPPRLSLSDAPMIPLSNASIFSVLTYAWVSPIMTLGYQRTLQAPDLWKLDHPHTAEVLAKRFDDSWSRRTTQADEWNDNLENGHIQAHILRRISWFLRSLAAGRSYNTKREALELHWRTIDGRKHPSLAFALNDTVGFFFWSGGLFKVFGDTSQLMGPILVKAIINFAKENERRKANNEPASSIGVGIALSLGLFAVTICSSIGQHQFFWRSMVTGVLVRAALIKSIYRRGMNLTGKARLTLSNSNLMNHVSTDVSRIDNCAQWFHAMWTGPIQIVVCIIILLFQLGPSALAGFALFVAITPLQERMMAIQFQVRKKSMKFTEERAKTLLEVLSSMRVVKYFTYETAFLKRLYSIRANELSGVKTILILQSANLALAFSIPVLAASLAFVTYTHVVPGFDVAVIFASLSLFQLLRQPMMFLPRALSATSDARSAISRLHNIFSAENRTDNPFTVDPQCKWALQVDNATFEWEQGAPMEAQQTSGTINLLAAPFKVEDITMHVQQGSLVAIVGRVGSGKSSLLSGLIGDMRRVSGSVTFKGRVAYCSQTAWIQNATVRDNILFGQEFEEERYWQIIEQCCLLHDLELLGDGDLTEIGEKGVNLSGGQKQRINIARALYYNAEVVILDDPLSAVDAHVGKALFHGVVVDALRNQGKTVIFVTHALHFLSYCDYIYTVDDGQVAEEGTFSELMAADREFARLHREFGGGAPQDEAEPSSTLNADLVVEEVKTKSRRVSERAVGTGKLEGKLIVKEQRSTGSISLRVYKAWMKAGSGFRTIPFVILAIVLMQGSQITSSYSLIWWQANQFRKPFSFYQVLYALLGISQSFFTFLLGFCTDIFSYLVSRNFHHDAVFNIFYAPMSFFDTTPMGRIVGIFGKDIDNIDNQLPVSLRMLVMTLSNVFGSVIIITIVEHYFIIVAVLISFGYQYFAAFYRASAREVKRLDSMLRSLLYSHMSESLTGIPTLRSYGEIPRFIKENESYIDLENRALFLTVTNQRWLAIRLDFCGALLVFFVALFAVLNVSGTTAAQVGLVLTYTTSLTQACGMLTRQTAEVENYLNSVERVVELSQRDPSEQEPPHEIKETQPPSEWPEKGEIEIQDLTLQYRPGLPNVLHGISMSILGGEKIGIVGRTGAGKSSITMALLRIIEYRGLISIDSVDISKIGLKDLRTRISIIPQDPTIFSGTVRTALDPFSVYDDVRLWDALRRSHLVETRSENANTIQEDYSTRLNLDTVIESEGSNFSVGERSLLSLARALVRDSKIVILDEATASVDLETDQKIQQTIQTEFKDKTLICIAHRLRTILSYDRILVLESGIINEFDTPLTLYRKEGGVFRSLCEESNIVEKDIITTK